MQFIFKITRTEICETHLTIDAITYKAAADSADVHALDHPPRKLVCAKTTWKEIKKRRTDET